MIKWCLQTIGLLMLFVGSVGMVMASEHGPTFAIESGYGDSDWDELTYDGDEIGVNLSVPVEAMSRGTMYGFDVGYQFARSFAVEVNGMQFATSDVRFNKRNVYPDLNGATEMTTDTQVVAVLGKCIVPISRTVLSGFADAGAAFTHRKDILSNHWQLGGSFGVGMDADLVDKTFIEFGFQYSTGYGKSDERPADYYIPFTYTAFVQYGVKFAS